MPGRKVTSGASALSIDNGDNDSQQQTNDREDASEAEDGPPLKKVRWGGSVGSGEEQEEEIQEEESSESRENVSALDPLLDEALTYRHRFVSPRLVNCEYYMLYARQF